jgi:hypothetical protein
MSLTDHAARGIAAGALILSLTATSFAGSANAAPLVADSQDCSTLAHERNDAVHLLHTAWTTFRGDLKDLAREARKLDRQSRKDEDKAGESARSIVASANKELTSIFKTAHSDIQEATDLGQACKDQDEDETTTTKTTTTTNTTTATNTNTNAVAAPKDSSAPGDSSTGGHTFDTSGLADQYKDIVDKAIKDMQKVVDDATKALADLKVADETSSKTEVEKVKAEVEKAETERVKDQEEEHAKAKAERVKNKLAKVKGKSSDKSRVKSTETERDERD